MKQSLGAKLPGMIPRWAAGVHDIPDLILALEQIGFDDVVDGEHILFTPVMHHPGGSGNMVHGRDIQHSDRADTLVIFAAASAKTTTIRFTSSVLLPAAHSFGVLARQASTLDAISRGRFSLGVGMGWNADEFVAQGIPPKERDARAEDVVRACIQLWQPGLSSYQGRWIQFQDVISEPAPITPGGPPIWWGGNAVKGPTARRVAEFCQGWLSREAADYDEIARSIESIRYQCAQIGRDPATVYYRCSLTPTGWPVPEDIDRLIEGAIASGERLGALGVTNFTVPLNYYQLDLGALPQLLAALRSA